MLRKLMFRPHHPLNKPNKPILRWYNQRITTHGGRNNINIHKNNKYNNQCNKNKMNLREFKLMRTKRMKRTNKSMILPKLYRKNLYIRNQVGKQKPTQSNNNNKMMKTRKDRRKSRRQRTSSRKQMPLKSKHYRSTRRVCMMRL